MTGLIKNVASQNMTYTLLDNATGNVIVSANGINGWVTKDNGTQASAAGTFSVKGNGQYNYAPTQAETNATDVGFLFIATSAITVNYDFHTDICDGNFYPSVNVIDIAGSASTGSSGYVGIDWGQILNKTAVVDLTQTIISKVSGDVGGSVGSVTGAVGSVTAGVTVAAVSAGAIATASFAAGTTIAITSNIKKNQALAGYPVVMTDNNTHNPRTGLTVSASRSLDGGSFADCANSVAEVANGTYKINLAAADLNANTVMLRFVAVSGDDLNIQLVTQP